MRGFANHFAMWPRAVKNNDRSPLAEDTWLTHPGRQSPGTVSPEDVLVTVPWLMFVKSHKASLVLAAPTFSSGRDDVTGILWKGRSVAPHGSRPGLLPHPSPAPLRRW